MNRFGMISVPSARALTEEEKLRLQEFRDEVYRAIVSPLRTDAAVRRREAERLRRYLAR